MAEMKRAETRYREQHQMNERYVSTVVVGACLIAAVRLAREENISTPSPRVTSAVADSVALARMILNRVVRV